ncbi:MAG: HPr(Ser) kinase/phosphatase [Fusobacteriaceae bacterium]
MKGILNKGKGITLKKLAQKLNLEFLVKGDTLREIEEGGVYKVGYEFTGFFQCEMDELYSCVHVIGKKEANYLKTIPEKKRYEMLENYFSYSFPAIILSEDSDVPEDFFKIAKQKKKSVLRSSIKTTETFREVKYFLQNELSQEIIIKDYIFMEIYGVGVLIGGYEEAKFGVTIELLERKHKFITDDNIVVKKINFDELLGSNRLNKNIRDSHFFLVNKDNTKIDVTSHFGIKSTRTTKRIDIIIELERWNEKKFYDRLGLDTVYDTILGIMIPTVTLPVRKGRNLAVIVETAAMNHRLKKMGINSAEYFWEESKKIIAENKKSRTNSKEETLKEISVEKMVEKFKLEIISGDHCFRDKKITRTSLHRPSLALAGYYDAYEDEGYNGIQVFSEIEFNFLKKLSKEERVKNLEKYFTYNFPMIVVPKFLEIPEYFLNIIKDKNQVLCRSELEKVAQIMAVFNAYLETCFAPTVSMHGVFLELYGFGVLLVGKSGVGKSETALELIHRGHRLVADDLVKFSKNPNQEIIGKSAKLPYFMEVRGLGIIDIKALYGLGAVRISKKLDAVIELKDRNSDDYLSSVSYINSSEEIVGQDFDKSTLYISSGRNASAMVEIAVMNLMAKKLGHDSEKDYKEGLKRLTLEEKELLDLEKF